MSFSIEAQVALENYIGFILSFHGWPNMNITFHLKCLKMYNSENLRTIVS